ncbi:MAG: hypothetical protein R3E96_15775 [Planctomycetota bacterium]
MDQVQQQHFAVGRRQILDDRLDPREHLLLLEVVGRHGGHQRLLGQGALPGSAPVSRGGQVAQDAHQPTDQGALAIPGRRVAHGLEKGALH